MKYRGAWLEYGISRLFNVFFFSNFEDLHQLKILKFFWDSRSHWRISRTYHHSLDMNIRSGYQTQHRNIKPPALIDGHILWTSVGSNNRNRNCGYQFQHNRIRTATAVFKNTTTEAWTATAVFWKLTTDPSLVYTIFKYILRHYGFLVFPCNPQKKNNCTRPRKFQAFWNLLAAYLQEEDFVFVHIYYLYIIHK